MIVDKAQESCDWQWQTVAEANKATLSVARRKLARYRTRLSGSPWEACRLEPGKTPVARWERRYAPRERLVSAEIYLHFFEVDSLLVFDSTLYGICRSLVRAMPCALACLPLCPCNVSCAPFWSL